MTLDRIKELLDAKLLTKMHEANLNCRFACSSDLMSDVLAFSKDKSILLTGLINIQVVRTADMMDIKVIIFVRGKEPSKDIIDIAEAREIVILSTKYSLFEASGRLYSNGLGCDE